MEYVITPQFDSLSPDDNTYLMKGLIDGKLSYVDRQGGILKLKSFDQIGNLNAHFSALIAVKIGHKWGFMNQNTQIVINPQFEQIISHIKDNLLLAKKDGEWGGLIILPL